MKDIHDIKPLLAVGIDWRWLPWLLAALAAAGALLLLWRWWRRRGRAPQAAPAVPLPSPEAEALAALDALAAHGLADGKRFYFDLTAILKRYLERRYGIPAAEMTVEELLPQVARLALGGGLTEPLQALCRQAEPIKFAEVAADPRRMPADLEFVRDLVRRTTPAEIQDPPKEGI
jgi:hypothetical protein